MSTDGDVNVNRRPPSTNKTNIAALIEALRADLLANENRLEDMFKEASFYENDQLDVQMNKCFGLRCELEDFLTGQKELEFKDDHRESTDALTDFISTVPRDSNGFGPGALVVVTSREVEQLYRQLLRRLTLDNVEVVHIGELIECNFQVPLNGLKTALFDGSQQAYSELEGSETVRLVVSAHVPSDRLFVICSDTHREICFRQFLRWESTRQP